MMIRWMGWLALALFISSCAKPMADFTIEQNTDQVPATLRFKNQSQNAENVQWSIENQNYNEDSCLVQNYYLSGRHTVSLTAVKGDKKHTVEKEFFLQPPTKCLILIETSMGNMIAELYDKTPLHKENMQKLAEQNFYQDLLFHRVMQGFMIQGGDPNSRNASADTRLGTGGPGYQIPAEFVPEYIHVKGALAAARAPDHVNPEKKSSGSQFYLVQGRPQKDWQLDQNEEKMGIVYSDQHRKQYLENGGTPFLDTEYTVFGQVIDGLEVIDRIAESKTAPGDRPIENIKMKISLIK